VGEHEVTAAAAGEAFGSRGPPRVLHQPVQGDVAAVAGVDVHDRPPARPPGRHADVRPGHRVHHARMIGSSVVASLNPRTVSGIFVRSFSGKTGTPAAAYASAASSSGLELVGFSITA
jgi:hypothetical protein